MTDAVGSTTASTNTAATTSSTQSDIASGAANLSTGYTTFLTLLTTQLKNQDPTSPLDTNQFTQQLVQMTGVQQQLLSNQLLQTLVTNSAGAGNLSSAVGLIGKTVDAASTSATLTGGQAAWQYSLPSAASSGTVKVTDSLGNTVYTGTIPDMSAGTHAFTWNGKTTAGTQAPNGGVYNLAVTAADVNGGAIAAQTVITGQVASATTVAGQVVLKIGNNTAPLTAVTAVRGS